MVRILCGIFILMVYIGIHAQIKNDGTSITADFTQITNILGMNGQMQDGAFVIRYPRSDLKVTIAGENIPTALGLVSWVAWKPIGKDAVMMGNFVLTEDEIAPFMLELERGNIHITGTHSHFLNEKPRIVHMYINGIGNADSIAKTLQFAISKTATPVKLNTPTSANTMALDTGAITKIIGQSGILDDGVYKFVIGRSGVIQDGVEIPSSMGLNSWAGFIGTNDKAHVAGDIVMSANEVSRVIRTLKSGGINVVSIHNYSSTEKPRTFVLHYWGTGSVQKLARTIAITFDYVNGPVK